MDALVLARIQFMMTTVYHFFFVPVTLGMSLLVAIMQSFYVATGNDIYKRMTKFWGKLFLINFAVGVVTGIVQEFQFGMNWSEYSRFMGDIFGVPLAIEALLAFFMESIFIGVWIFGWDKLPKKVHLASIWLVALGSNLSALWILIANSFMQEPVGFLLRNGRVEMTNFMEVLTNPNVWIQWPHVFFAALTTGGFLIIGISAWHLLRKTSDTPVFRQSFKIGAVAGVVGSITVALIGHAQAQHMIYTQPMKMAAAEALWNSADPASLSLLTIGNEPELRDVFAIRVPNALSFLAYNTPTGQVRGIKELQKLYTAQYGPGNYIPPVALSYWSFRLMIGSGLLMIVLSGLAVFLSFRGTLEQFATYLRLLPFAIALPYLANTTGWLLTELGRQPWIVFGLMTIDKAVSPTVPWTSVLFSLIFLTVLITGLVGADAWLLVKYARKGVVSDAKNVQDGEPGLLTGSAAK